MIIRLVCLLALSSLSLTSPIGQFEKELKNKGLDVDKIHEELKSESEDVEEELAGKESQEELAKLRAAYITSTNGTNEVETEMEINGELSEDLFEGVLTPEQRARQIDRDAKATRERRHAVTDATKMWTPMGNPVIPYTYADGFPIEYKMIINDALEFWATRTCIRFRFRPARSINKNIIEFNHNTTTCTSEIGMVGGKQQINLDPSCFSMTTVTHALAHVFGIMHVQSRYDRDKYITVNWDNIKEGYRHDFFEDPFELGERGTYNISYEFGSLMHYRQNAHAINRTQPTITAKDEYSKYQHSMGSPLASFYDILLINRMYKCTAKCDNKIECANNGVQDANKCKKCYCPKGWAGTQCKIRPKTANVTKLIGNMEIEMTVEMKAPRHRYAEKLYVIEASIGKRINASVTKSDSYPLCDNDRFFEIIPTEDTRINGIRFCDKADPTPIESNSNQMLVWMYNALNRSMSIKIDFVLV